MFLFQNLADRYLQLFDIEAGILDDEVFSAELESASRRLDSRKRGNHNHHGFGRDFAHAGQQIDAVDVGHLDIGDDQVVDVLPDKVKRARAVFCRMHGVAFALEHEFQQFAHAALVIDD